MGFAGYVELKPLVKYTQGFWSSLFILAHNLYKQTTAERGVAATADVCSSLDRCLLL